MGNTLGDLSAASTMAAADLFLVEQSGNSRKVTWNNLLTNSTWTPTLGASTANGTHTYNAQTGHYVQIGKLVIAWFRIDITTVDAAISGSLAIKGLPVTPSGSNTYSNALARWNHLELGTNMTHVGFRMFSSPPRAELYESGDGAAVSSAALTDADLGTTPYLEGTLIYSAA